MVKNLPDNAGDVGDSDLIPGSGRSPGRRAWQPTLVFLSGETRDRGAWWAAVYGVSQSRTHLTQLSSSSISASE